MHGPWRRREETVHDTADARNAAVAPQQQSCGDADQRAAQQRQGHGVHFGAPIWLTGNLR